MCREGLFLRCHCVVIPALAGMAYSNHWIPAFAGMTTRRKQLDRHPDSPFAMFDTFLTSAPSVIPAQAGIQWFIQDIPARAGMTTKGSTQHATQ